MISKEFKKFELDYNNYFLKKIEKIKDKYPEITNKSRRTGKALKNICFFIWYYAQEEDNRTIDLLLKSSILVSAQDNFYDNINISYKEKERFYYAFEEVIKGKKNKILNQNKQFKELISLWEEIRNEAKKSQNYLYKYWQEKSLDMTKSMLLEDSMIKNNKISFNEYMKIAVNTVGIIFVWSNYFLNKHMLKEDLKKIDPILIIGAEVSRLSNDLASYRRIKKELNAVTLIDKKYPKNYIVNLVKRLDNKFNRDLLKIKIDISVKKTIKSSVDFLVNFYKNSDFS